MASERRRFSTFHASSRSSRRRLSGPRGTATAHRATTSDSAAVTAVWTGQAGESLYRSFSAEADSGFAYLDSFQVVAPA